MFENEIEMDNKIVGRATAILDSGTWCEMEAERGGLAEECVTRKTTNNNERK